MAGFLIPLCALLAGALLASRSSPPGEHRSLRSAVLLGMLAAAFWTVLGAELLSLRGLFTRGAVLAWWAIPAVLLAGAAAARWGRIRELFQGPPDRRRDRGAVVLAAGVAALLLITLPLAAAYPTTTWDCWNYHLPRQYQWIQQASVAHFGAHHVHQLQFPPMAEFLGAHWMLLSGHDGWSNMHQWFAVLGCVLAASLAARELGAGGRGQALAGLIVLLNPAALTQAVNGKNDLVAAFWILMLAWMAARAWRLRRCTTEDAALMGVALGLALLTKGTSYVLAIPTCIAAGVVILRVRGVRGLALGVCIVVVALTLNIGHWTRNYELFGSPLGHQRSTASHATAVHTPASLASGLVKNIAMHAASPSAAANERLIDAVAAVHRLIGFELNDPRTTLLESFPYKTQWSLKADGNMPSPFHLVLALILLGVAAVRPRLIAESPGWLAFCVPLATFAMFALMVRWQPWQHRLEIPVLTLFAPIAGCILPRIGGSLGGCIAKSLLIVGGAALALTNLAFNSARPLIGEASILKHPPEWALCATAPGLREPLKFVTAELAQRRPTLIGHAMGTSAFEYPVLRTIRRTLGRGVRVFPLKPNFGPMEVPVPEVVVTYSAESAKPLIQYGSKRWFLSRATHGSFGIYTDADAQTLPENDLHPFFGWESAEGLSDEEGPFPKWDLPVVRWARESLTTLRFTSVGGPTQILVDCRRNDRVDQAMVMRLNGRMIHRFEFGGAWRFFAHHIKAQARPGENTLTIEYANRNEPHAARSVQFRRLQIITPRPEGHAPPAPAP